MQLHYGEIVELLEEDGIAFGKIRVGGSVKKMPLELLTEARCGDKVLMCDGVAISRVEELTDVSRDSR